MPPRPKVPPLSPDHEALGKALRQLRVGAQLTQEQLADRVGTDAKQVGCVERGTANPTYTTLVRLATALETSVGTLTALADRQHDRG